MKLSTLTAISPIDGRYLEKVNALQPLFSEFGLMKHRLIIEIKWLETLANNTSIHEIPKLSDKNKKLLYSWIENFTEKEASRIKSIEKKINHDVKAIEYFIKEKIQKESSLKPYEEFVHFSCTSEDINNLSYALMIQTSLDHILLPTMKQLMMRLQKLAHQLANKPILAHTHGQPASPTTMGKEIANFTYRLQHQYKQLKSWQMSGKINGAVGNYNAHVVAYPEINWEKLSKQFVENLGLAWHAYTTQIEPHDTFAELSHHFIRANNILVDLCKDIWTYISIHYFTQKTNENEVGSSTMPHKINPIDFENAEGNLGLSNALFDFFANKLPISRLQRDLSDSTVMRNIGVAFAHSLLAYQSLEKGLAKLQINQTTTLTALNNHWEVLTEALQTVMRRYGIPKPYEKLKQLSRGKKIDKKMLHDFIDALELPEEVKQDLKKLKPENYLGKAAELAKKI